MFPDYHNLMYVRIPTERKLFKYYLPDCVHVRKRHEFWRPIVPYVWDSRWGFKVYLQWQV